MRRRLELTALVLGATTMISVVAKRFFHFAPLIGKMYLNEWLLVVWLGVMLAWTRTLPSGQER